MSNMVKRTPFAGILAPAMIAASLVLAGCSTLHVSRGAHGAKDSETVAGVPFYVKRHVYEQVTTYRKNWYRARVLREEWVSLADEKPPQITLVDERFVDEAVATSAALGRAVAGLAGFGLRITPDEPQLRRDLEEIVRLMDQAAPRRDLAAVKAVSPSAMVSNVIRTQLVVDDSNVYYINGVHPISGKGEATFKLSAENTLTEVESALESKPQDLVTGLLPVKEYLTEKYVTPLKTPAPAAGSDGQKALLSNKRNLGLLGMGLRESEDARVVRFRIEFVPEGETTTLSCRLSARSTFDPNGLVIPVDSSAASQTDPNCRVEKVVVAAGAQEPTPDAPAKEAAGWKLEGQLTPPKAAE